jgi:ATP-binding cassette subfamily C protein
VLNGINFTLEAGQSLAIVGPSGSGKSTLARIMVGCLFPTSGKVRLDGTELRHWDRKQFGEYTGYLPQEVELFPGTIRDNICRMRTDVDDTTVLEAARSARTHEMITQLVNGYETVLDRNGAPLSGGQKQRVALARAFFGSPALVVLDEPNSNLDGPGGEALMRAIQQIKAEGRLVIIMAHRPAAISECDMLLVLQDGAAQAFGPRDEVLREHVRNHATIALHPQAEGKR